MDAPRDRVKFAEEFVKELCTEYRMVTPQFAVQRLLEHLSEEAQAGTSRRKMVRFIYFKPSGKMYSSTEVPIPEGWRPWHHSRDEVFMGRNAPGLSSQAEDFFVVGIPDEGVPFMLPPVPAAAEP